MKFASFDLESAQTIDRTHPYIDDDFRLLGITCAAVALVDTDKITSRWYLTEDFIFWSSDSVDRLTKEDCQNIVVDLMDLVANGYTLVTWNGTCFDFKLLAIQSGMYEECANIAYNHHIDMMLFIVFYKGYRLKLQSVLDGIGSDGKLNEVVLNDGTLLHDMGGVKAPELWAQGEFDAVLAYLTYDVSEPLNILQYIYERKRIQWLNRSGNYQVMLIPKLQTVKELYENTPDHSSWEKFNICRSQFIDWMSSKILY
jgi:hypothetical protein